MNILVCVKQVPDLDALAVAEGADGRAMVDEATTFHMNQYDAFAVEAAVRIREEFSSVQQVHVDAVTAGPGRALDVIRRAVGMGARNGIHLRSSENGEEGPESVAAGIARYAQSKAYDLILTGSMSEDGMNGQVGPRVAACLNLPCAIHVVRMELDIAHGSVVVEKEIESGRRMKLRLQLPAVLAVQSGINRPRYPSLSNLLRANRQKVETIPMNAGSTTASIPSFMGTFMPQRSRTGNVLKGTAEEKAETLIAILQDKAFLSDHAKSL